MNGRRPWVVQMTDARRRTKAQIHGHWAARKGAERRHVDAPPHVRRSSCSAQGRAGVSVSKHPLLACFLLDMGQPADARPAKESIGHIFIETTIPQQVKPVRPYDLLLARARTCCWPPPQGDGRAPAMWPAHDPSSPSPALADC